MIGYYSAKPICQRKSYKNHFDHGPPLPLLEKVGELIAFLYDFCNYPLIILIIALTLQSFRETEKF